MNISDSGSQSVTDKRTHLEGKIKIWQITTQGIAKDNIQKKKSLSRLRLLQI